MPIKRYNGSSWDVVAGAGVQGATGASGNTIVNSKGDLLTFDTAAARLPVGTNGQSLVVDSSASTGLKWATPAVSGTIKQTVTGSYNTLTTTTSDTPVDTGLSLSITPTSSTSKILVIIAQSFGWLWGSSAQSGAVAGLYRDSTQINSDVTMSYGNLSGASTDFRIYQRSGFWYLDSPATTSTITYKTMFNKRNSGSTAYANRDGESFITLIEIGA